VALHHGGAAGAKDRCEIRRTVSPSFCWP
jgi:hypothetical protein